MTLSVVRHPELAGLLALAVSALITYLVRQAGRRYGWYAPLRSDRWHEGRVALHGGVGIFIGFLVAYLITRPAWVRGDALLVLAGSAMFVMGLVDDIWTLRPVHKLVGQITAASALTAFGLRLHWTGVGMIDVGLTLFWLVGLSNAVNLLDNIDGLAGGTALIASVVSFLMFRFSGQPGQAAMAAALAGAAGGFLIFNIHPASIFMGDGGSLFLGFLLGGMVLLDHPAGPVSQVGLVAGPLLVLALPILDTTLVMLSRLLAGRPLSQGGKDHASHRLVALGLSDSRAVVLLWSVAAIGGALAWYVRSVGSVAGASLVGVFFLAAVFLAAFVSDVPVYAGREEPHRVSGDSVNNDLHDHHQDLPSDEKEKHVEGKGPVFGGGRARIAHVLKSLVVLGRRARVFEVLNDLVCILVALFGAFLLRWGGDYVEPHYHLLVKALPALVVIQLGAFLAVGLYRPLWRYTTVGDLVRIASGVSLGVLASVAFLVAAFRFEGYSRAMFLLDAVLLALLLSATRLSFRVLDTWIESARSVRGPKTLIYGAGESGRLCLTQLRSQQGGSYSVVGFLDDDPMRKGRTIHGVSVLGGIDDIEDIVARTGARVLVVASTDFPQERIDTLQSLCAGLGLDCLRLRIELVRLSS